MVTDEGRAIARAAVEMVAEYLSGIKLSPHRFSAQIALCQLLELADEDPGSEVAQWILSADRNRLWKKDAPGKFYEDGDEPLYVCFREAWEDFRLSESPVM